MERSGPSLEMKVVLLVAGVLAVENVLLVILFSVGAHSLAVQTALGSVLVLALVIAAVWGNAVSRAVRRLSRACYVARSGDTRVLSEPARTDELGELNDEINRLVAQLRDCSEASQDLDASRDVADALERHAPEILRAVQELLVSLKELSEGAGAEIAILRKVAGCVGEARTVIRQIGGDPAGLPDGDAVAAKTRSLSSLAREVELLSDSVIDEVARPVIDEASLARAVNGLRDAARTMSRVADQAVASLEGCRADSEAAATAVDNLVSADSERADARRVAELMERSASSGLAEAGRLAATVRKLGLLLEARRSARRARGGSS